MIVQITSKRGFGSSSGTGASPPRPFGGHSQSIPQCMVSDVYALVNSSFWETKLSPNEFFDFDPSSPPYLGTTAFFLGGGAEAHTTPVSTRKEHTPSAEVHTTPAETMKVRAMPTCTACRDGVHEAHAAARGCRWRTTWTIRGGGGAIGPHAHGNAVRHVVDDPDAEGSGQQRLQNDPCNNHRLSAPTTGLRYRGNDTTRNTGRSSRQNAATRRSTRREERVTVQGPGKKQQIQKNVTHGAENLVGL